MGWLSEALLSITAFNVTFMAYSSASASSLIFSMNYKAESSEIISYFQLPS